MLLIPFANLLVEELPHHRIWGAGLPAKEMRTLGGENTLMCMRALRDFRPGQIYGVTQRGNRGQWVYADAEHFTEALRLMGKYARRYEVRIHGWALMHNH